MSTVFFDRFFDLEEIEEYIDSICEEYEEKEEIWNLVDQLISCKVINFILDFLDEENHEEFLKMFFSNPSSYEIVNFLEINLPLPLEEIMDKCSQETVRTLKEVFWEDKKS